MSVNQKAYSLFVEMGTAAKPAQKAVKANRDKLQGAYNIGVQAAILCGDLPTFKATIEKLESDIRYNRDGLAVTFGAPKRERPSEKGEKYTIPGSVSNVKAALLYAFEHEVPLADKDGKALTFGQIRKSNSAVKAKLDREAGTKLAGTDLMVWQVQHAARALLAKAAEMDQATLESAAKAIAPWIPKPEATAEQAATQTDAQLAAKAGEQLAPAAAPAKPARSARRSAKGGGQQQAAAPQAQAA